jgi:hypothetical protein
VRSSRCKFGGGWGGEGIGRVERDSEEGWWRGIVRRGMVERNSGMRWV